VLPDNAVVDTAWGRPCWLLQGTWLTLSPLYAAVLTILGRLLGRLRALLNEAVLLACSRKAPAVGLFKLQPPKLLLLVEKAIWKGFRVANCRREEKGELCFRERGKACSLRALRKVVEDRDRKTERKRVVLTRRRRGATPLLGRAAPVV
jgi:hypothetical protein